MEGEHILGLRMGTSSSACEDEAEVAPQVAADEEVVEEGRAQITVVAGRQWIKAKRLQ